MDYNGCLKTRQSNKLLKLAEIKQIQNFSGNSYQLQSKEEACPK